MSTRVVTPGASAPLGATVRPGGVNFSVFSKGAALVELLLFDDANAVQPARAIPLKGGWHRTQQQWWRRCIDTALDSPDDAGDV